MAPLQYQMLTKVGPLYLVASRDGLRGVSLRRQHIPLVKKLDQRKPEGQILAETVRQLKEYFSGARKKFDLFFCVSGTVFQQKVWRELSKIPLGKTVSYRDIARKIKNPKAVRAVGSANRKNPFCIIVPCHRVISSDGSMGGYAGGIAMKRQLLDLEKS